VTAPDWPGISEPVDKQFREEYVAADQLLFRLAGRGLLPRAMAALTAIDEAGDEPVITFRGRDAHLLQLLSFYYNLCGRGGAPPEQLQQIARARAEVAAWQQAGPGGCARPLLDQRAAVVQPVNLGDVGKELLA